MSPHKRELRRTDTKFIDLFYIDWTTSPTVLFCLYKITQGLLSSDHSLQIRRLLDTPIDFGFVFKIRYVYRYINI